MIIWLASFPRSGNTFFRILMQHLYGLPTYTGFRSGDDLSSVGAGELTGHATLPPELRRALMEGDRAALAPFHQSKEVYAIKSHMTAHETLLSELPTILLVRDPYDVLVSYVWYVLDVQSVYERKKPLATLLRHPRRNSRLLRLRAIARLRHLGLEERMFKLSLHQAVRYPRWSVLNDSWMDRPQGGLPWILRFEDLLIRPREAVQEALAGVGLDVTPTGNSFPDFEELKRVFPSFFRQGKAGEGRQYFSSVLREELSSIHGATMKRLGYSP